MVMVKQVFDHFPTNSTSYDQRIYFKKAVSQVPSRAAQCPITLTSLGNSTTSSLLSTEATTLANTHQATWDQVNPI